MAQGPARDDVGSSSVPGAARRQRLRRDRGLCASADAGPYGRAAGRPDDRAPSGRPVRDAGLAGDGAGLVGGGTLVAGRYRLEERLSGQDGSSA